MAKSFSKEEVASHNKGDNLWLIVDEDVYDLTAFQEEHPGMFVQTHVYTSYRVTNQIQGARRVRMSSVILKATF